MNSALDRIEKRVAVGYKELNSIPEYSFHYKICKKCNNRYSISCKKKYKYGDFCSLYCQKNFKESHQVDAYYMTDCKFWKY
jgi:hypothetical protein